MRAFTRLCHQHQHHLQDVLIFPNWTSVPIEHWLPIPHPYPTPRNPTLLSLYNSDLTEVESHSICPSVSGLFRFLCLGFGLGFFCYLCGIAHPYCSILLWHFWYLEKQNKWDWFCWSFFFFLLFIWCFFTRIIPVYWTHWTVFHPFLCTGTDFIGREVLLSPLITFVIFPARLPKSWSFLLMYFFPYELKG